MFNVVLYKISKNENSTKQPTASDTQITLSCRVLDASSIISPTITITAPLHDVREFNYAYIEEFKRYYWINDIIYDSNIWTLKLSCDVLATYRDAIGGASLYVLRSANAFDGRITDNYYAPVADYTTNMQMQEAETLFSTDFRTGKFLVSSMGLGGTGTSGSELQYQVNWTNFQLIMWGLYTQLDRVQLGDVINWVVQKMGGNPKELLSGIVWFPFPIDFDHQKSNWVYIGGYKTEGTGEPITNNTTSLDPFEFNLPKHPKAGTKGVYLNAPPFTYYQLYVPGVGLINLDGSKAIEDTKIEIYRTVDTKGKCLNTIIGNNSRYKYATVFSQIGIPIELNGDDAGGVIGGLTSTAIGVGASIFTGGVSAIIGGVASGIGSIAGAMGGASSNTNTGSVAGLNEPFTLQSTFYDIPLEDINRNGRPLCAVRTPASLGGFMIVQRGDVEIDGTFEEMKTIKQFLEGGFYYE